MDVGPTRATASADLQSVVSDCRMPFGADSVDQIHTPLVSGFLSHVV